MRDIFQGSRRTKLIDWLKIDSWIDSGLYNSWTRFLDWWSGYSSFFNKFEVKGFVYKPIGVILKVTPNVNAKGDIRLTLSPEVSQTNGNVTFGGAAGTQFWVDPKERVVAVMMVQRYPGTPVAAPFQSLTYQALVK